MFERQGDLATVAMSGFRAPRDLLDSSFSTTSSSTPSSEKSLSFKCVRHGQRLLGQSF